MQKSEILCKWQDYATCTLVVAIKKIDIYCYLFILNHGTKNAGGLLMRWMPVQQQDGVIDYNLFNCIPCLSWKQGSCTKARPTAAETTVICFAK